jgi:DNA polymerase-1
VAVDGSQWELRTAACESGDPYLINAYAEGTDFHSALSDIFFPNGWTKEDRANVKRFVFAYAYGGSAESSASVFEIPKEGRDLLVARLNADLGTFIQWRKDQFVKARTKGVLRSRQGRTFHFPLIVDKNYRDVEKWSVNYTVSGPASDLVCVAAAQAGPGLRNMGVWPLFTVHDSLIMEAPEGQEFEAARYTAEFIEGHAASVYPEIPWVAEAEMSKDSWGAMKEVEL